MSKRRVYIQNLWIVSRKSSWMEFGSSRWWFHGLVFQCFKNRDAFTLVNGGAELGSWHCRDTQEDVRKSGSTQQLHSYASQRPEHHLQDRSCFRTNVVWVILWPSDTSISCPNALPLLWWCSCSCLCFTIPATTSQLPSFLSHGLSSLMARATTWFLSLCVFPISLPITNSWAPIPQQSILFKLSKTEGPIDAIEYSFLH